MAKISFGLVSVMMYIKHRQMLFFNLDMIFPHLQKAIQKKRACHVHCTINAHIPSTKLYVTLWCHCFTLMQAAMVST